MKQFYSSDRTELKFTTGESVRTKNCVTKKNLVYIMQSLWEAV